ncbi:hypothetical protein CEXT_176801 [Caerostris extrusa]|uniref:Uncharacterized protein n=1 Tax=Caerostris extrusa TaxID=172846 RepID=A0AAV4MTA4_CAEEX|nr:hypothetical protein CEXT_176801 [Caerostris extrusa]
MTIKKPYIMKIKNPYIMKIKNPNIMKIKNPHIKKNQEPPYNDNQNQETHFSDSQNSQCSEGRGPLRDVKDECMPINKENTFNENEKSLNIENEEEPFSNEKQIRRRILEDGVFYRTRPLA